MKEAGTKDKPVFDPPVRVAENGRQIHISVGLAGIAEEKIRIDLEKNTFTVSVLENGARLKKRLRVPEGARFVSKRFFGGVLEVFLAKPV
jgi:HSP20 family molecular chaperone IbpA